MVDFPSKVTTETSSPQPQQGAGRLRGLVSDATSRMDMSFLRSVPAALMAAETVLGLLHWALIAGAPYWLHHAYGWVMFVAVSLWILTTLLFLVLLFSVPQRLSAVPWTMTVMMYNGVAALLYLTAFLTNAATVRRFNASFHGHIGAAAVGTIRVPAVQLAGVTLTLHSCSGNGCSGNGCSGNGCSCSPDCDRLQMFLLSLQFFGAVLTLLYGAGTFLSYLDWRADGGNAATSTVPT